jgi:hypothetical protein
MWKRPVGQRRQGVFVWPHGIRGFIKEKYGICGSIRDVLLGNADVSHIVKSSSQM